MANTPIGSMLNGKVDDLRSSAPSSPIRVFVAKRDKDGNILRDKKGNPILGGRFR